MGLIWLLIGHLLGDFSVREFLNSRNKKENFCQILLNAFIYFLVMILFIMIHGTFIDVLIISISIFIMHLTVDTCVIMLRKLLNNKGALFALYLFLVTQALYIGAITIVYFNLPEMNLIGNNLIEWMNSIHNVKALLLIIFAYLLVLSPTAHLIKLILNVNFPSDLLSNLSMNTGSFIGKLERVIILTLGVMGLYTSMAFVFTAKSLARFKQLEDRDFAEKYLIGTLLSFLIAILLLVLLKYRM
jgi:hypothetical protein